MKTFVSENNLSIYSKIILYTTEGEVLVHNPNCKQTKKLLDNEYHPFADHSVVIWFVKSNLSEKVVVV